MSDVQVTPQQSRAIDFAVLLLRNYRAYHDHKEAMGYGAATLFIGGVVAGLAAETWPPEWVGDGPYQTLAFVSLLWLLVLVVLKWQLRRRRWAALRLAGVERLLAKWVTEPPTEEDLRTWVPSQEEPKWWTRILAPLKGGFVLVADHVWPLKGARVAVDVNEDAYPTAFVTEWQSQWEDRGTGALLHEGILVAAGWGGYALLAARTVGWL